VQVHEAAPHRLALSAAGPVAFDVAYELSERERGSEVRASISVRPGRGLSGRVLASATSALLSAGALERAVGRIARLAGRCLGVRPEQVVQPCDRWLTADG
jgi:hypothetical protein